MPRPRSARVQALKDKLIARLQGDVQSPGQSFFSNRALAAHFGVSYQTAHRLIRELTEEGYLTRRRAAGTFVSGPARSLRTVELLFHPRAQRPDSFGGRLLAELKSSLRSTGIPHRTRWVKATTKPGRDAFSICWECPELVQQQANERRFCLVLNQRPPSGLASGFVDSVATDDFLGGSVAADLLRRVGPPRRLAVLTGPDHDPRSQQRVAGFQAHAPNCHVVRGRTWFAHEATGVAARILQRGFDGVFCVNDRLAEAVLTAAAGKSLRCPALVGFDDAPIAEKLDLTTIAIPWRAMIEAAGQIARRRLDGDTGPVAQMIFSPVPVIRQSSRPPAS